MVATSHPKISPNVRRVATIGTRLWKPLVYVAGPYRAASEWKVKRNVDLAERYAIMVWRLGAACICPHKNTERFGGAAPDSAWIEGDMEIVRRCDALLVIGDWQRSEGTIGEIREATRCGIPIFFSIAELAEALKGLCEPVVMP